MERLKSVLSCSRYRLEEPSYALTDKYFAKIVNGNLICTDTEEDIDCCGNICLVTTNNEVYHLGVLPRPEVG